MESKQNIIDVTCRNVPVKEKMIARITLKDMVKSVVFGKNIEVEGEITPIPEGKEAFMTYFDLDEEIKLAQEKGPVLLRVRNAHIKGAVGAISELVTRCYIRKEPNLELELYGVKDKSFPTLQKYIINTKSIGGERLKDNEPISWFCKLYR